MPTTIDSAGITFNDTTTLTSANIGTAQLVNGSVIASKLGTNEQKQIAKAWVNFNGTTSPPTIRSSYNVSSITKHATGQYTVNFATQLSDANYSISASIIGTTTQSDGAVAPYNASIVGNLLNPPTTSGFRFQVGKSQTVDPLGFDVNSISTQVFGN